MSRKDLNWVTDKVKALGVWIRCHGTLAGKQTTAKKRRDVMISDYTNGSLGWSEWNLLVKRSISAWVKNIKTMTIMINRNHFIQFWLSITRFRRGRYLYKSYLNKNDLAKFIHISDAFTTEILKVWYDDNLTSTENLLSLPLWQNSAIDDWK